MATLPVRRRAVVVIAVVAVIAAAAVVWYLTRPAPAEVSLDDAVADVAGPDDDASAEADPAVAAPAGADGTWTVDTSVGTFDVVDATGTFVGFRIDEELANVGATTAVGRTPAVSGSATIEGTTLTAATVEADLTAVVSDEPRRDSRIQAALETDRFPTATFTLIEPVELGDDPTAGGSVAVTASGELSVHGVTQTVDVPLEAALVDGLVVVTGSVDVALSDFGVTAPTAPIVLSVADTATVELQLYLSSSS